MIAPPHATSGVNTHANTKIQPPTDASFESPNIVAMMSVEAIIPNAMTILAATRQTKSPLSNFAPKTKPEDTSIKSKRSAEYTMV